MFLRAPLYLVCKAYNYPNGIQKFPLTSEAENNFYTAAHKNKILIGGSKPQKRNKGL